MNIAHIGFTVSDLDAAIDFFVNHFGFHLRHRQIQDNPYTRATVGVPDAVIDNAILSTAEHLGAELQLLQYIQPECDGSFLPAHHPGATHLALVVDDIREIYGTCINSGVEFVSPPNEIDTGRNTGGIIAYAIGPDGLRVELFQPATVFSF
ncbi:VOC family protein [Paeniglutamicibacter antarcticus]|uniref:VOC family protein n=1 Tax=Arthrobacter terrae TaxID=2935737 RepID=A0A931G9X7_9MICC|nr:VOC family protein [Arthrobacter terrae]MBG0741539.1 VOC family protein [Arthrobacter terrae]